MKKAVFGSRPVKEPKAPSGKKPFSSRTVIGVVCILLALGITFGVAPLVNRFTDQKADIVRLKVDVLRGQVITAADLEVVNVGSYNLPGSIIKDKKEVVGKYAAADLFAGDYLFAAKLTTDNRRAEDVLNNLSGQKVAVSVSIGDFAEGLSNKLENGDIVSVIVYDRDNETSYIPPTLKYVQVITSTTKDGVDKDEAEAGTNAETVTVLVTPEQAEQLAYYNAETSIHFTLVYRGDSESADQFIQKQDEYIKANPIDNTPKIEESEEAKEDANG